MALLSGNVQTNWFVEINGKKHGPFPNKHLAESNVPAILSQLGLTENTFANIVGQNSDGTQVLLG